MSSLRDRHAGKVAYATVAAAREAGYARGEEASDSQPRVPIIGLDSGCIPGTKPGCFIGQAAELDRAARDLNEAGQAIVRRKMREARKRLKQGPQQV